MDKYTEKIIDRVVYIAQNDWFNENYIDIDEHNSIVNEYKDKIEQLQSRSQEYQKDIKMFKKECEKYYISKNLDKKELMDKYTRIQEESEEKYNEYENEIQKLEHVNNKLEQKIVQLSDNNNDDYLFLENQQLKTELQRNNNSVLNKKLQTSHSNNEQLRKQILELQSKLDACDNNKSSIDTELLKQKVENVRNTYSEYTTELENKYTAVKYKYNQLKKKNDTPPATPPASPPTATPPPPPPTNNVQVNIDSNITAENIDKLFDIMYSKYTEKKIVNRIRVHKNQIKNKLLLKETKEDDKLDYGCEYFKKILELYSVINTKNTEITKLNGVVEFLQNK